MGKPSPPEPTPPKETAAAQTATNIGTAIAQARLNNVNQTTPYGRLIYKQTGARKYHDPNSRKTYNIPKFTAIQKLNPAGERIQGSVMDTQENLAGLASDQSERLRSSLNEPFWPEALPHHYQPQYADFAGQADFERAGDGIRLQRFGGQADFERAGDGVDLQTDYQDDFAADRRRVEQALLERARPEMDQRRRDLRTQLVNQGFNVGDEGYQEAMDEVARAENDLLLGAILAGGEEQSRMTNLARQEAAFGNEARLAMSGDDLRRLDINNELAQQAFQNRQATVAANNQARLAMSEDDLRRLGINNELAQLAYDNRQQQVTRQNNLESQRRADSFDYRQALIQERLAQRNQPVNEISALLSGSQVQQPQFLNTPRNNIPVTDYAGIVANYDRNRLQAYQMENQNRQSLMGGLFGLGAGLIRGF